MQGEAVQHPGIDRVLNGYDPDILYQNLVNHLEVGVVLINLNGQVISTNKTMAVWLAELDLTQNSDCHHSFYPLPNKHNHDDCPTCQTLKDGSVHEIVVEIPLKDHTRQFTIRSAPLQDALGALVAVLETFEDITEQKQMLEELSRHRGHLKDLVEERAAQLIQLNDPLAHEIKERSRIDNELKESQETAHALLNATSDLAFLLDAGGKILVINATAAKYLGYKIEDLVNQNIESYLAPIMLKELKGISEKAIITGLSQHKNVQDGPRLFDITLSPVSDFEGRLSRLAVYARDITESRRAEMALQQANQKLQTWVKELEQHNRESTLLNEMGDQLTACFTSEEVYHVASQFMELLFPDETGGVYIHHPEAQILEAVAAWGDPLSEDEITFTPNDCWSLRRGQSYFVKDSRSGMICHHVTSQQSITTLCIPMMAHGEALGILHLRGPLLQKGDEDSLPGISEAKQHLGVTVAEHLALALSNIRLQDSLRQQAIRDPLTGLYNRRYLEETLEREIRQAQRESIPIGVIMFDIDHLKDYNDTYGHALGDYILQELGKRIQAKYRGGDIACRYGGDEFVIILPGANAKNAFARAEQLRQIMKGISLEYNGQELPAPSLSAGVAVYPVHGSTTDTLLRIADKALYQAKQEGRDRVIIEKED